MPHAEAPLTIYDTMQRRKVPLTLVEPGKCGIYCCGPTVYDMSHIGHGLAALLPDVLVRYLRSRGLEVTYVRNITDVDDKIIKRAHETGADPSEVSAQFTAEYHRDMSGLGMLDPDVEPRVTDHMDQIRELIKKLVDAGFAYCVDGDVFYRVHAFSGYGKLSRRNPDELQSGARVEVDARKESPLDFALWKAAKPGEPSWDSPWGAGRPGWHIECSAMSTAHLGTTFDIHVGGRDLIFPHHENEIAQSQGAQGEESYARHWMHNGFVKFAGEKMSKSLGNFFTIREVTALYHPEVLRYFLLSVQYRSPVNFDVVVTCPGCQAAVSQADQDGGTCGDCGRAASREELRQQVKFIGLEEADERVAYVYETLAGARMFLASAKAQDPEGDVAASVSELRGRFNAAMADDLNTAAAMAELSEALSEANRLVASGKGTDKGVRWRTLRQFVDRMDEIGTVLGVFGREPRAWLAERRDLKARRVGLDVSRVTALVAEREAARTAKDWETADRVRDELGSVGVTVRDGPDGSSWTL